jgi:alkylation response protein AidB-like acyl-CoA dehydrogenase
MNFERDDEQRVLADAVSRFAREAYPWAVRKLDLSLPLGERSPRWADFAEIGLFGLLVPDAYGGMGRGARDAAVVAEQLGRAMVVLPFAAVAVGAVTCLARCDNGDAKQRWLPDIALGRSAVVVGSAKLQQQPAGKGIRAQRAADGGWRLSGSLEGIPGADTADAVIVEADLDDGGSTLVLLTPADEAVRLTPLRNHDGTRGADLELDAVHADDARILVHGPAAGLVERVRRQLLAFGCSEAVGTMGAGLDLTLDFLRSRQQFGVPLSSFQVLQHRCVDVLVAVERARSMAALAAWAAEDDPSFSATQVLSAAKVQIGLSARFAGQAFIQLHGGMGMTDEYPAGHAFRRLTAIDLALGTPDEHVSVLASGDGLFAGASACVP